MADQYIKANLGVAPAAPQELLLAAQKVDPADFDSLTWDFDGVVQEMSFAFATARWPGVALEAWIYHHQGKTAAAALVMVQSLPLRLGHIAIAKWGPILARTDTDDRGEIYAAATRHLTAEYADRRRMMLTVMARAEHPPLIGAFTTLMKQKFEPAAALKFPNRYMVNLRLSDEQQRKSYSQKWRYHLNKSEKEGLLFEVADDSKLGLFDQLYNTMTDRKNFTDYSGYATVQSLFQSAAIGLRPRLFFVYKDGVAIAGAIIFTAGKTAVYLYGATNDQALRLRAGYFMHAKIISWLRDNSRTDFYDLGGTDGFLGLHQFKKGMVGSAGLITVVPHLAHHASHPWARIVGVAAYMMRDRLLDFRKWLNNLSSNNAKPDLDPDAR